MKQNLNRIKLKRTASAGLALITAACLALAPSGVTYASGAGSGKGYGSPASAPSRAGRPSEAAEQPWGFTATMSGSSTAGGDFKEETVHDLAATCSNGAMRSSATGDLWTEWTGTMNFLSGSHGDGSRENPYQISTKAQLMGLSELAAMGMTVRGGTGSYPGDYSDCCFRLVKDIDLGGMDWMPIGFYQNEAEMSGEVSHGFSGVFDGNGKKVSNFYLDRPEWRSIGFFGRLEGAEIVNLKLEPSGSVTGVDEAGILAGSIRESQIRDVTVRGDVKSGGSAGGLAGNAELTVIENCTADVTVNAISRSDRQDLYVGGIVGKAAESSLVDVAVSTGDNSTSRIQGQGYVGGITGFQNGTDIYRAVVSGTIGGAGSLAAGGVSGLYHAGQIKVVQFSGKIGSSGLGSSAHEGTFIGTRQTADHFVYGRDLSYLFADRAGKIMAGVCGSDVPDDNDFTYDAHIGYWHTGDLHYTLVQGGREKEMTDSWFYEELERGVLSVMDDGSADGELYEIDHYAPDRNGRPARGYLVSVPQIDVMAGGSVYTDVAELTVKGDSTYDRPIDKERRGAVAAGSVVSVATAAKNTGDGRFQLTGSGFVPDRTHHSVTYTGQAGNRQSTTYVNGGNYTFVMPACHTEVTAAYEKVSSSVAVSPQEYRFKVVQTRTGDRKRPDLVTEVRDGEGKLLASCVNGGLRDVQVQPIQVTAAVDQNNEVVDRRVKWSLDDTDLLHMFPNGDEDSAGYTDKSASVFLNMDARFFKYILAKLEKEQADGGYRHQIPDTIFGAGYQNGGVAVLTASTRPDTSYEQKVSTACCRIQVTFQIVDRTYVAQEGVTLDKSALLFTVTRRLTGDRRAPSETIVVSQPQQLTAAFEPEYFSKRDVRWKSSDTGIAGVSFAPGTSEDDKSYRFARVEAVKDAKWIQDLLQADRAKHINDPYARSDGHGDRRTVISVEGRDVLGNICSAACDVTVYFRTEDETRVIPESISLNHPDIAFDLAYKKSGDRASETVGMEGFEPVLLSAALLPELKDEDRYRPFKRSLSWYSSDPSSVTADENGQVVPVKDAEWILKALEEPPFAAEKEVVITAISDEGNKTAKCRVHLRFQVSCIEVDQEKTAMDIILTAKGPRQNPQYIWSGEEAGKLSAAVFPSMEGVRWVSSDPEVLSVAGDGRISWNRESYWVQDVMKNRIQERVTKTIVVKAFDEGGQMEDFSEVTVGFQYKDQTYSSSGGGGSSQSASVGRGSALGPRIIADDGSVNGIWKNTVEGRWEFTGNDRAFAGEWGFIHNPYAAVDQNQADWFRFDETGAMVTGWFQDTDGHQYFLNTLSDNTLGRMMTGWTMVEGKWYYFMPESTEVAPKGALARDCYTPDGYRVNQEGEWTGSL